MRVARARQEFHAQLRSVGVVCFCCYHTVEDEGECGCYGAQCIVCGVLYCRHHGRHWHSPGTEPYGLALRLREKHE